MPLDSTALPKPETCEIDLTNSDSILARLHRARAHLVRHGWCQHALVDYHGRVCIRGALAGDGLTRFGEWDQAAKETDDYLQHICGSYIPAWNNAPGRTAAEVLALLDHAILLRESRLL